MKFDKLVESILENNDDSSYLKDLLRTNADFYHFWLKRKHNLSSNLWREIEEYVKTHFQYKEFQLAKLKQYWENERNLELSALGY